MEALAKLRKEARGGPEEGTVDLWLELKKKVWDRYLLARVGFN